MSRGLLSIAVSRKQSQPATVSLAVDYALLTTRRVPTLQLASALAVHVLLAAAPAGVEAITVGRLALVINNGLAPPNPANVIDAANSFPEDVVFVQNVGCNATVQVPPCFMPGDPTSVELVEGGSVGSALEAFESSTVTMRGGRWGPTSWRAAPPLSR